MVQGLVAAWALVLGLGSGELKAELGETANRTFEFTYAATITGVADGQTARIWLPVPPSNEDQEVKLLPDRTMAPEKGRIEQDAQYGNRIFYIETKGEKGQPIRVSLTYRVTRREVRGGNQARSVQSKKLARFLQADAKVPVGGKTLELLKGKAVPMDPMAAAKLFYDVVDRHMRYSKDGIGWGFGDSEWACQSGFGNCSDFHSLFISMTRAYKIPAKFEIGFPLPEKRGEGAIPGYHCWAKFWISGKGWIPVDISEANKNPRMKEYYFGNLTADRIAFSTGRDITLAPKQAAGPLNFFIYPHVEVEGKPLGGDQIKGKFSFKDAP